MGFAILVVVILCICYVFESECIAIIKVMILYIGIAKDVSLFMFTLEMNSQWYLEF